MEILFVIGRLTLGIYFLYSGINHFFKANYLAGYAKSKGMPFAKTAVIVSGVTLSLGGISLIGWVGPIIGLALIVLTMIPMTAIIHNYWTISDPVYRANEKISFLKNIALMGAMVLIVALLMALALAL